MDNSDWMPLGRRIALLKRAIAEFDQARPGILHQLEARPRAERTRAAKDMDEAARYLHEELDSFLRKTP